MTLNEIITNSNLNNAERYTLRTILQEILNENLCSRVCRLIADKLWYAKDIAYTLYDKFTTILYTNIITNRSK